ncbi:NAC domain-containing protein [Hirschfeldia incana]|nr:NAC domain-containing protein [Hirschfeldia incana]
MMVGYSEVESWISHNEIIESYLGPMIEGKAVPIPGLIVELGEELYSREPWLLPKTAHPALNPQEWFYFGKRNRNPRIFEGVDHEGAWIEVTGRHPIRSKKTGEIIGAMIRFRYGFRNKGESTSLRWSNWFMREYRLFNHVKQTTSKRVVCKITENLS